MSWFSTSVIFWANGKAVAVGRSHCRLQSCQTSSGRCHKKKFPYPVEIFVGAFGLGRFRDPNPQRLPDPLQRVSPDLLRVERLRRRRRRRFLRRRCRRGVPPLTLGRALRRFSRALSRLFVAAAAAADHRDGPLDVLPLRRRGLFQMFTSGLKAPTQLINWRHWRVDLP